MLVFTSDVPLSKTSWLTKHQCLCSHRMTESYCVRKTDVLEKDLSYGNLHAHGHFLGPVISRRKSQSFCLACFLFPPHVQSIFVLRLDIKEPLVIVDGIVNCVQIQIISLVLELAVTWSFLLVLGPCVLPLFSTIIFANCLFCCAFQWLLSQWIC